MQNPLLLMAAAAKDPPLIDFDLTVLLQFVIFVTAALVLSKYLFRPFLDMRAARAEGIDGAREQAGRMDDEAKAQVADYDVRFAQARTKAADERGALRKEAAERESQILAAARQSIEATVTAARQKLDADAKTARAQLEPRAAEIARTITKKILGREVA